MIMDYVFFLEDKTATNIWELQDPSHKHIPLNMLIKGDMLWSFSGSEFYFGSLVE